MIRGRDPGLAALDKPDYEGCVLMVHVEGDYYLIEPELQ